MKGIKKYTVVLGLIMTCSVMPVFAQGNPYPEGWSNCTFGAWQALYNATGVQLPNFGDAWNWLSSAKSDGYAIGVDPAPGAIAVYSHHVAYVSAVDGENVHIIEGGYNGGYNERWVSRYGTDTQHCQGYIYTNVVSSVPVEPVAVPEPKAALVEAEPKVPSPQPKPEDSQDLEVTETSVKPEFDHTKANTEILPGVKVYSDDVSSTELEESIVTMTFDSAISPIPTTNTAKDARIAVKDLDNKDKKEKKGDSVALTHTQKYSKDKK